MTLSNFNLNWLQVPEQAFNGASSSLMYDVKVSGKAWWLSSLLSFVPRVLRTPCKVSTSVLRSREVCESFRLGGAFEEVW